MRRLIGALLATSALCGAASAQRVIDMPLASTPLSGNDVLYVIQNGQDKQTPAATFRNTDVSNSTVIPPSGTTAQTLATLSADIADVRAFGAICDGTNNGVTTAVNLAVTAGYKKVLLPKNCFYVPTANTTPAGVSIIGEDWATSTVSVAVRATDSMSMGAKSRLENVAIISHFCDTTPAPVSTQKACPVGRATNASDTANFLTNWVYQSEFVVSGPTVTAPGTAVASTDIPNFACETNAVGADCIYTATSAASAAGIRIVTGQSGGAADVGIYLLNGFGDSTLTDAHSGIFAKEFANNSTGNLATIRIDRVGDATNVTQSLQIDDTDSLGSTNTRPFVQITAAHQSSGFLVNVFQSTTPYSGRVWFANMGNAGGTFTGSFIELEVAGAQKFNVDSNGVVTSSTLNNNAVLLNSATGGAHNGQVNGTDHYLINNVADILAGTSASIGGGALLAGACTSGTATVTGATTAMTATASPVATPLADATHGLAIWAYVSASDTVTVEVCAIVATTPTATTYRVRVLQ